MKLTLNLTAILLVLLSVVLALAGVHEHKEIPALMAGAIIDGCAFMLMMMADQFD